MSPRLVTGALLVVGWPPTRRQMTVAGGLASATQRNDTESMFSSRSTVGVPTRLTSGASVEKDNDVFNVLIQFSPEQKPKVDLQ